MKASPLLKAARYGIFCAGFALFGNAAVQAGPLELVPDTHATVAAALAAVSPGGTVRITNSATYTLSDVEVSTASTNIKIEAAPGASPTLKKDAASTSTFMVRTWASCKIGSNNGGRITLDGSANGNLGRFLDDRHPFGSTVTYENILITGLRNSGSQYVAYPRAGYGNQTYRNIKVDTTGAPTTYGFRCDNITTGRTMLFERVDLSGGERGLVGYNSSFAEGTITATNCQFAASIYGINFEGSTSQTLNLNYCWVRGGSYNGGISSFDGMYCLRTGLTINASYSTFVTEGDGNGVYLFNDSGPRLRATFDHCDLIGRRPDGGAGYFGLRLISSSGQPHLLTFTNTNLFGNSRGLFIDSVNNETVTSSYSNFFALGGTHVTNHTLSGTDISINPGYPDYTAGNFAYSNSTVATSDNVGGPIGTQANFDVLVPVEVSAFSLD